LVGNSVKPRINFQFTE